MKKTYQFWVYACIEVEVNGNNAIHKTLNESISGDDITKDTHSAAYAILKHAAENKGAVINLDYTDIFNLSIKES